jgi:transcriptional regulator with XRE-family HTH domain
MKSYTNLKIMRENRGYTVRALGEITGIPFSYIASIERGRMNPTGEELERLCKALHVTLDDLYPNPEIRKLLGV